MIETPAEVFEVADRLEARLGKPAPHEQHTDWDSIKHRMDDTMRNKLRDLYGIV